MNDNSLTFERLVFGKLVQRENGPIVRGPDHGIVTTPGFPQELIRFCQPSKTGLGAPPPNLSSIVDWSWERYPWKEEGGGILCIPKIIDDSPGYMLVARMRLRDEDGEEFDGNDRAGASTRLYHQAHYTAIKIKDWDAACIGSLSDHLKATPLVKGTEGNIPTLCIPLENRAKELPNDWFENVSHLLRYLLTGEPFFVRKLSLSVRDFLSSVMIALLALPKTLAWRIPFGAGLIATDLSDVRFAHVVFATGGIQELDGGMKGAPDTDSALMQESGIYLEWLRRATEGATTYETLVAAIVAALPEYSRYDSLDVRLDWQETFSKILSTVRRKVNFYRYSDWVDAECSASRQPATPMSSADVEVFQLLLTKLHLPECLDLIAGTAGDHWRNTWTDAFKAERDGRLSCPWSVKGVAQLFGAEEVSPQELARLRVLTIPGKHLNSVVNRVTEAVKRSNQGKNWARLYAADDVRANWIASWKKQAEPDLYWLGLKDYADRNDETLLQAMNNCDCDRLLASLGDGRYDAAAFETFLKAYKEDFRNALDGLLNEWLATVPLVACRIMEQCADKEITPSLYRKINDYTYVVPAKVVQRSLSSIHKGNATESALFRKVAVMSAIAAGVNADTEQLGRELSSIVSGKTQSTQCRNRRLWTTFVEFVNAGQMKCAEQYGNLCEFLARKDSTEEARIFFNNTSTLSLSGNRILAYASHIYRQTEPAPSLENLSNEELRTLRGIVDNLPIPPNYETLFRQARSAEELGVYFDLSLPRALPPLSYKELSFILGALFSVNARMQSVWEKRIKDHAPADAPLWRIIYHIAQQRQDKLKPNKGELATLEEAVNGDAICLIASCGIELPGKLLNKVSHLPRDCNFNQNGLGLLAKIAKESRNERLAQSIIVTCVNGHRQASRSNLWNAITTSQFYSKNFISSVRETIGELLRGSEEGTPKEYADIIAYLVKTVQRDFLSELLTK